MEVKQIKTSKLIPYARNNKKHDESQIKKIASSLKEFGWKQPVVIDKNNIIIAGHGRPTPKPLELCQRVIKSSSRENDIVLDVFGGSGSTLVASEQLKRKCYTMEYEPKWTDVIVKRYHNLDKNDITLVRDDKEYKWDVIKKEILK